MKSCTTVASTGSHAHEETRAVRRLVEVGSMMLIQLDKFFLEKNDLSSEFVQQLPGFDPEHFERQLAAPFPQAHTLTIRPE